MSVIKRRNRYQIEEQLQVIREYQDQGKSNQEISEITGIPIRTVQRYTGKIHDADIENMKILELDSSTSRYYKLKQRVERVQEIADTILEDERKSAKDRMDCAKIGIECEKFIINILESGVLSNKSAGLGLESNLKTDIFSVNIEKYKREHPEQYK